MLTRVELFALLRKSCSDAGGQSAWAEMHGVSASYLSDVVNSRREPGDKILAGLGLRKVVRYVPAKAAT